MEAEEEVGYDVGDDGGSEATGAGGEGSVGNAGEEAADEAVVFKGKDGGCHPEGVGGDVAKGEALPVFLGEPAHQKAAEEPFFDGGYDKG